jgi:ligand-binding sensor domain-containing protein
MAAVDGGGLRLSQGGVMYFNATDGFFWGNAKGGLERAPGDEGENGGLHVAYWDRQGGIWVGRIGKGLRRREAAELLTRRWGTAEGLRDPVFGVQEWGGRMVAGSLRGVYELEAGERSWRALPETMVKYGGAPAMATARDGALLFGVNRGAPVLARVERDGRVGKTYFVPPVQDGPNVYSLLRDSRGFLWVGSARRLYRSVEKGMEIETTPVELGVRPLGADIYAMQLDEKLRLLAPTAYGLFRVDGEKVERFRVNDGFRFEGVRFIGRDGKGR